MSMHRINPYPTSISLVAAFLAMMLAMSIAAQQPTEETAWKHLYHADHNILTFHFYPNKIDVRKDEIIQLELDRESSQIMSELIETNGLVSYFSKDLETTEQQKGKIAQSYEEAIERLHEIAQKCQRDQIPNMEKDSMVHDAVIKFKESQSRIFLDFQIKRMNELKNYAKLSSLIEGLASKEMRDELGLTDTQIESMRKRKIQLEEEFFKDVQELGKKYRDKAMEELSQKQREEIQKTVGEPVIDDREGRKNSVKRFLQF